MQGRHGSAAFASLLLALLDLCSEPQEPQEPWEAEISWRNALSTAWESVPNILNEGLQINSSISSQHSSWHLAMCNLESLEHSSSHLAMCSLEVAHQYTYNNLTCKPPLIISEVATARAYNQKICRESWTATERMFGSVWYWESYAGFVRDLLHPTPRMIPEEFTESEEEPEVPEVEVPQEPKQEIICVSVCLCVVCLCVCVFVWLCV
jgi:hypothetical protein